MRRMNTETPATPPSETVRIITSLTGRFKMTQAEISKKTGISRPTLSKWSRSPAAACDQTLALAKLEARLVAKRKADRAAKGEAPGGIGEEQGPCDTDRTPAPT